MKEAGKAFMAVEKSRRLLVAKMAKVIGSMPFRVNRYKEGPIRHCATRASAILPQAVPNPPPKQKAMHRSIEMSSDSRGIG
ncbi:MAG: hypothetical protein ACLVHV_08075 [Oscillospiraceae bacterium]